MGTHHDEVHRISFRLPDDFDERFALLKEDLVILKPSHLSYIMDPKLSIVFLLLRGS